MADKAAAPSGSATKAKTAADMKEAMRQKGAGKILSGSTVYLSGPMDFVASRADEKKHGWRNRVGEFLESYGVTVYDPWNKPMARGLGDYGKEDEFSTAERTHWTFADTDEGHRTRARLCSQFWPTLHIDLRMTDTADFLVAFVPTNIYSVGTVHEIVTARQQHKPVLFVSPPISFPAYDQLLKRLESEGDTAGAGLLRELEGQAPLRVNQRGIPSMWYMALIDSHYFFDGFGWADYKDKFGWPDTALDKLEKDYKVERPLLRYLEKVATEGPPKRYDLERDAMVDNPEWLLFDV